MLIPRHHPRKVQAVKPPPRRPPGQPPRLPPPPSRALREYEPRWIHPDIFVFLCPHCRAELLSCKRVPMERSTQCMFFAATLGDWSDRVVPCKPDHAWVFVNAESFHTISITPSLDAGASGHWHGHITAGKVVGGVQLPRGP